MERAARYGSHAFLFVNLSIGEQEDKYSISIMITQNDLKNAHPKKDREDLSLLPIREATITYLERVSISEYNQTWDENCLLYTSPSPRDRQKSRMPSSA